MSIEPTSPRARGRSSATRRAHSATPAGRSAAGSTPASTGPASTGPASRTSLVTAVQLAAHLGVSLGQIHRLSAAKRIPRVKLGHRTVRFDLEKVVAALGQTVEPPTVLRPTRAAQGVQVEPPVRDLPAYDWSPPKVLDGTLPPAERRG